MAACAIEAARVTPNPRTIEVLARTCNPCYSPNHFGASRRAAAVFVCPAPSVPAEPVIGGEAHATGPDHDPSGECRGGALRHLACLRRAAEGPRHRGDAGGGRHHSRRRQRLPQPPVPHDRHACRGHSGGGRSRSRRLQGVDRSGCPHGHRLHGRRSGIGHFGLHRHVDCCASERPHGRGRSEQPGRRHQYVASRRRGLGLPGGGAQPDRRFEHLRHLQPRARPPDRRSALPHRRLRLRRELRGPLRPAWRWYLHQGRRRGRRPRRQGRGGHSRGRPPQRCRYRRPGGRQRGRLRRPRRGPLRVDER